MSHPRPPFQRDYPPPRHGAGPGPGPRGGPPRGPPPGQFRPPPPVSGSYGRDDGYGGGGGRNDGYYDGGGYSNAPAPGPGPGLPHRGNRGGRDRRDRQRGGGGGGDFRDRRDSDRGPPPDRGFRDGPPHRDRNGPRSHVPPQQRPNPTREQRLERLAKERVSRTLFIRNIAYETDSDAFRALFEAYGEIKEWFDVIPRRGMVFVTYYDVRGAEAGRAAMHGYKQLGRPIDVHFGLPKEHDHEGPCDRTKNQGSLRVSLHPRRMLDERELGRAAEPYGAVKSIKTNGFQEQRILEYFDSRAAVDFHDRMNGQPFVGGTLGIEFIWDVGEVVNPDPITAEEQATQVYHANRGERGSRGYTGTSGRDGRPDEPPARYDGPSRYSEAPPVAPGNTGRLEEARKVQDLLASLGNISAAPPAAQPPPPPPSNYPPPAGSGYPPPANYGSSYPAPAPAPSAPYQPPQSSYPPPASASSYPPAQNYPPHPAPPSNYRPPPSQSAHPHAASPPPQGYGSQQGYQYQSQSQPPPPPQQGYSLPPRPQDPRQRPPQQGYQGQSQQGRDNRDVGSLLAMLNR